MTKIFSARQGEVLIIKKDDFQGDFKEFKPEGNHYILGHSETGHHHVIDRNACEVMEKVDAPEGMSILKLIVKEPTKVEHLRGYDTHKAIHLDPGHYEVRNAREYTPEGYKRVID